MSGDAHNLIKQQFGSNAINYATSEVHAKGASLSRLVELMEPKAWWRMLDIATAAGHTAFMFAPHVIEVVASDLVEEMLVVARGQAAERKIDNVSFELADAEALPFEDNSFDAVTCRIAPHHFADPERFLAEARRVLRPGGRFGLVDNMVNAEASQFVNRWERKRDPSHIRAHSMEEWLAWIEGHGFTIVAVETMAKRMRFQAWVENMSVSSELRQELLADLQNAPEAAHTYLRPDLGTSGQQGEAAFHLTEGIVIAAV